jgi:hypothetical protein
MAHWRKDKNPNYLGACDFDGGDKILTIKTAKNETIQGGMNNGKNDLIIRWVENEKPWIVNNTNGKMISKVLKTTDDDFWPGKKIQLYATTTMVAGSEEECVRVRNYAPTTADMCADCGKEIKAAQGMTAVKIAEYTEGKYGRKLCAECAKKAAESTKEETVE